MQKVWLLSCLAVSLALPLTPPSPASAQLLDRVARSARGDRLSGRSRSRRRGGARAHPWQDHGDAAMLEALLYPFFGPVFATGDRWGPEWWLADHPYADGVDGYAVYLPVDGSDLDAPPVQDIAVSASAEGGYLLGDAGRSALELRVMLPDRFEIDVRSAVLFEPRPAGTWSLAGMQTLHLGLRFAQDANWQFHVGMGARLFHDRQGAMPGFDFRYQVDVFPARPWVVSVRLSLGNLGRALTVGGRVTIGLALGPVEVLVGYDHLAVIDGVDHSRSVDLSGPIGGLRIWI
ncbi:MAG: hypothetical protein AB8I08_03255 [Sandaracinaceae bacterium]